MALTSTQTHEVILEDFGAIIISDQHSSSNSLVSTDGRRFISADPEFSVPSFIRTDSELMRHLQTQRELAGVVLLGNFSGDTEHNMLVEKVVGAHTLAGRLGADTTSLTAAKGEARRSRNRYLREQVEFWNQYIQDAEQPLWVEMCAPPTNEGPTGIAELAGFELDIERYREHGPKPSLLVIDGNGEEVRIPEPFMSLGLYIESVE